MFARAAPGVSGLPADCDDVVSTDAAATNNITDSEIIKRLESGGIGTVLDVSSGAVSHILLITNV